MQLKLFSRQCNPLLSWLHWYDTTSFFWFITIHTRRKKWIKMLLPRKIHYFLLFLALIFSHDEEKKVKRFYTSSAEIKQTRYGCKFWYIWELIRHKVKWAEGIVDILLHDSAGWCFWNKNNRKKMKMCLAWIRGGYIGL